MPAVIAVAWIHLAGAVFAQQPQSYDWTSYDQGPELQQQAGHSNPRMRFRLLNSRYLDKNTLWTAFSGELEEFTRAQYEALKPLVLEQGIPALQRLVRDGRLSYETLVKFYLFRIRQFESDNSRSLKSLIALNPDAVRVARGKDRAREAGLEVDDYSLFGIPVLLKDNIGTTGMTTTAGALALRPVVGQRLV